jgi:hypothetical protein
MAKTSERNTVRSLLFFILNLFGQLNDSNQELLQFTNFHWENPD